MTRAKLKPKHTIRSFTSSLSLALSAESGLTYTQSEMGVDGESGWRVVMTSQAVGRLPALSRPARGEPTDTRQQQRGQNSDGCSNRTDGAGVEVGGVSPHRCDGTPV